MVEEARKPDPENNQDQSATLDKIIRKNGNAEPVKTTAPPLPLKALISGVMEQKTTGIRIFYSKMVSLYDKKTKNLPPIYDKNTRL
ncbi:MAG: hypothetical protein RL013_388 [Bacteroidota bacterium]|jgi:hypothetical protein